MDPNFWHQRWEKNQIGFHESDGNTLLKRYFEATKLAKQARIFVPMCGKTRDIAWLLDHGFEVIAVELNESAVIALFEDLGATPSVTQQAPFTCYSAPSINVLVGDFFELTATHISQIDAIYDRAALVAMPEDLRRKYAQHLCEISANSKQLLITFEYDQTLLKGPPFSVSEEYVQQYYHQYYDITRLYHDKVAGGFRGLEEVYESVYLLETRQ